MSVPKRQAGAAVLLVFWALLLAAGLIAALALTARSELAASAGALDLARARHLADGAVHLALRRFAKDAGLPSWQDGDGTQHLEIALGGVTLAVTLVDEAGKVDLNAAPRPLIEAALRAAGVAARPAERLATAVLGRRGSTAEQSLGGARPEDAGFLDIAELLLLPDMTDDLFRRLAPLVTVHSGLNGIDAGAAPAGLLRALAWVGADGEAIERLLELRRQAARTQQVLPLPPIPGAAGLLTQSHRLAFTVAAEAPLPSGANWRREAVVWLRGDAPAPFALLAWREPGYGRAQ